MNNNAPIDRQILLNSGQIASKNLPEILKIDFGILLDVVAPKMPTPDFGKAGISQKMVIAGEALLDHMGPDALIELSDHISDTVRGLAIFGLAKNAQDADIEMVIQLVRSFAADPHFGVREWSWLATRPKMVWTLDESIMALVPWTSDSNLNLRRFAVEALRPRGVWCKHIAELRADPSKGLALLEPMKTESEKYAQDSVANWLNDAAKDQPDWVQDLCLRWEREVPNNKATKRIVTRGQRSIK